MFCLNCGKEIPAESKFCPFCGQNLSGNGQAPGAGNTGNDGAKKAGSDFLGDTAESMRRQANEAFNSINESLGRASSKAAAKPYTFIWALFEVYRNRYLDFRGRSCRSEYWWSVLGYLLVALVVEILCSILAATSLGWLGGLLTVALYLGCLLPNIAVQVRRLHDTDRSWPWLLLYFVPFVGALILFIFFCQRGTAGPNRFGNDPLADA